MTAAPSASTLAPASRMASTSPVGYSAAPVMTGMGSICCVFIIRTELYFGVRDGEVFCCALPFRNVLTFCIAFITHILLSSVFNTLTASLLLRLLPHDRFAQFASASQILNSFWIIIFMPVIGKAFAWLHHTIYLYLFGFIFAAIAVGCGLWLSVWIRRRCGGLEHYQAP